MLKNIESEIINTNKLNITVIGDYCLDKYYLIDKELDQKYDYHNLPIYCIKDRYCLSGGAGNVVKNLVNLNVNVSCIGIFGDDGDGYELKKILESIGANTDNIIISNQKKTNFCLKPYRTSKTKYNKLNEIISFNSVCTSELLQDEIINNINNVVNNSHGIVIVEQFEKEETGILSLKIKNKIGELAKTHSNKFFIADSKKYLNNYKNIYLKCNQNEYLNMNNNSDKNFLSVEMLKKNKALIITIGKDGAVIIKDNKKIIIDSLKVKPPIDSCGAGDSSTAGIIIGLCLGYSLNEAVLLGNIIASITIKQLRTTGNTSVIELLNVINNIHDDLNKYINY